MKKSSFINKYKHLLNDIINILAKNKKEFRGRNNKYNNFFYINYIFRILFYGEFWNTIDCKKYCDNSTIRKKFYLWSNLGIFDIAYRLLLNKYSKNRTFKYLFIDSTIIQNLNCSDKRFIDYYYKIIGKKQTKISIICDNNSIPIIYKLSNPKSHDIKICKDIIKTSRINVKKDVILVGDKGYITKRRILKLKNNKRIKIIAKYRTNQKKINTSIEKALLRKRIKIENLFAKIKNSYKRTRQQRAVSHAGEGIEALSQRIRFIYDRNFKNYETFLKMAITCEIIKFLY